MFRAIDPKIDALFVEGPDDGAVVNALVKKGKEELDLAETNRRLIRTGEKGGGAPWALDTFGSYVAQAPDGARVGLIVDRDGMEGRPDNWPKVQALLKRFGAPRGDPRPEGFIIDGRFGIWMWPDNVTIGDLEHFVAGVVPQSPALAYAAEATMVAKDAHGAEYDRMDARKAVLKVRSVWRDATAAGGYGHLIRNLPLSQTLASNAFLAWFTELFLHQRQATRPEPTASARAIDAAVQAGRDRSQ
jgi:hypothetical protein